MYHTTCPQCRLPLGIPPQFAGSQGPCGRCGCMVAVPQIVTNCLHCRQPSYFQGAMLGMVGPCRHCGAQLQVSVHSYQGSASLPPHGPVSQPPQAHYAPPPSLAQSNAHAPLSSSHGAILHKATTSALKAGVQVLGTRVALTGAPVTQGETFRELLKASVPFTQGALRVDSVLGILLAQGPLRILQSMPFSGGRALPHEFACILPGSLTSTLWLKNGGWFDTFEGSQGGENDPLAQAAQKADLARGVEWTEVNGRQKIKIAWGYQLVALQNQMSVLVLKTAERGLLSTDYGVSWFLERGRETAGFLARYSQPQTMPGGFRYLPASAHFLDDLASASA
jgi:hypothetical protein